MKQCWADILNGCSEQYSKEHYIGRGQLFDAERVKTQGIHPNLDGRSMRIADLQAHILCQTHNNMLSEADQEAINLRIALEQLSQSQDMNEILEGNHLWTPTQYDVKGAYFGRWLCKLHCNYITLKEGVPPEYFVRSAFGEQTEPAIRYYVRVQLHDNIGYQQRIWYENFAGGPCPEDEYGTFHVFFMGLHFLVCSYDLTDLVKAKLAEATNDESYLMDWINKLQKVILEFDGIATKSVVFDWKHPV